MSINVTVPPLVTSIQVSVSDASPSPKPPLSNMISDVNIPSDVPGDSVMSPSNMVTPVAS